MKAFLILIVSFFIACMVSGQESSGFTPKKHTVYWKDVQVIEYDSILNINPWDSGKDYSYTGEGIIDKRKKVHSIKDLNKRELKQIKKRTAEMGDTIAYVTIYDSAYYTLNGIKKYFYEPTVYFLSVLPPKEVSKK